MRENEWNCDRGLRRMWLLTSLSVGRTPLGASLDEQSNTTTKGELPTAQPDTACVCTRMCLCACACIRTCVFVHARGLRFALCRRLKWSRRL